MSEMNVDGSQPPVDPERRKRARGDLFAAPWGIGAGLMLILLFDGYRINGVIPAPWFGWLLIGVALLGLIGVNVFAGGPLDKRLDQESHPPDGDE
jgi:hypothetical protein